MEDSSFNQDYTGPPPKGMKDTALRVLIWAGVAIVFCLSVGMSIGHPVY